MNISMRKKIIFSSRNPSIFGHYFSQWRGTESFATLRPQLKWSLFSAVRLSQKQFNAISKETQKWWEKLAPTSFIIAREEKTKLIFFFSAFWVSSILFLFLEIWSSSHFSFMKVWFFSEGQETRHFGCFEILLSFVGEIMQHLVNQEQNTVQQIETYGK